MMDASRRSFLRAFGSAAGLAFIPAAEGRESSLSYVEQSSCIEVFSHGGAGKRRIQVVPSQRPTAPVLTAGGKYLLTVNQVAEYEGLPTGSAESYAVHPVSGRLQLVSRQSLSLSATLPRHLAVAPDERHIVVAAFGGGVYNVLPLSLGGELGQVTQVLKEIGSGPHPVRQRTAHPHSLLFHPSGRFLFASDLGSDRVSVFRYINGQLARVSAVAARPGSGPAELAFDADRKRLSVTYELAGFTSTYSFDDVSGRLI